MTSRALLSWVALALIFAPSAGAKGLVPSQVCGESECVQIEDGPQSIVVLNADAAVPEPPVGSYYRLDYRLAGVSSQLFVPGQDAVGDEHRERVRWYSLAGQPGLERIRAAIQGVEPFDAPKTWTHAPRSAGERPWSSWLLPGLVLTAVASAALRLTRMRTA